MAIKGQSRSERFTRWQLLVNNLKESAALPHVSEEIAQLEGMLTQARALQDRYAHFRTQAREVLAQLDRLGRAGDKVRALLGANLRGKLGFTSESLERYGYKPNQVRRHSKSGAPEAVKQSTPPAAKAAADDDEASKSEA
jgi:hypothetical protein